MSLTVVCDFSEDLLHQFLGALSSVVFGRLFGISYVFRVVAQEVCRNYIVKRIFGLGRQDQTIYAIDDVSESYGRRVVSIENTMANTALLIHVAVVNWGDKSDFRGSERIVSWEIGI